MLREGIRREARIPVHCFRFLASEAEKKILRKSIPIALDLLVESLGGHAFPRTMLSKRIEGGELPDVVDLFDGLTRRLEQLVEDDWDAS